MSEKDNLIADVTKELEERVRQYNSATNVLKRLLDAAKAGKITAGQAQDIRHEVLGRLGKLTKQIQESYDTLSELEPFFSE